MDDGDRKDKLAKIVLPDSDPDPKFPPGVLDLNCLSKSFTIMRQPVKTGIQGSLKFLNPGSP